MTHEIGDIVHFKRIGMFNRVRNIPDGIVINRDYKIIDIRRAIDGAYDWDDLFFEGFGRQKFCEFDFEETEDSSDKICTKCGQWVFKVKDK